MIIAINSVTVGVISMRIRYVGEVVGIGAVTIKVLIGFVTLLLISCGGVPDKGITVEEEVPVEQSLPVPVIGAGESAGPSVAIAALLEQAQAAIDNEQLVKASALAERAIRIKPDDPYAYFSLAKIRALQGQGGQVMPLLEKAKGLAKNNPSLLVAIESYAKKF